MFSRSRTYADPEEKTEKGAAALQGRPGRAELLAVVEDHRTWLETHGEEGARLDLSRASLAGAELTGANLQRAILQKTDLRGADLTLVDLRGASLIEADLRGANLLGAELRAADLKGARLEGATGLWLGRLAATDLAGASLPHPFDSLEGAPLVAQACKTPWNLLLIVLFACLFSWAVILGANDLQVLTDSPALPFPFLTSTRLIGFFRGMPLILLALYVAFHLSLQRLWSGLQELPAILPDGHGVAEKGHWLLMSLARKNVKHLKGSRLPLPALEAAAAELLAYWVVPATLVGFWARALTQLDARQTGLHVILGVASVAFAALVPRLIRGRLSADTFPPPLLEKPGRRWKRYRPAGLMLGTGLLLGLLSAGTFHGVPTGSGAAAPARGWEVQKWAGELLWAVGYNPYADFSEQEISAKPRDWTGRDEDLIRVKGARLDHLGLRHAQAYRAFLANAHLRAADLRFVCLSEADLRGATLREANLESAVMDRARMYRANLQGANLQKANLARADLREADLSFAYLDGATLVGAILENANFYGASLNGARLQRSELQKADFREAKLENARLGMSNLRQADLWSAKLAGAELEDAQLDQTILIDADLRRADLRRANLQNAVLRGTDLSGTNLAGADLRGANQVTAAQICSAADRRGTVLDENMQHAVENHCGPAR